MLQFLFYGLKLGTKQISIDVEQWGILIDFGHFGAYLGFTVTQLL